MAEISVIVPTLGRPSLQASEASLQAQTLHPKAIIIKNGPEDTLIKIKEAVDESETEYIAIADDDAIYPSKWLASLSQAFISDEIGFVGGPCLALIDKSSNTAEKAIGEVTASYFGTSNMSYRAKIHGQLRDADETNLVGNGLYRREVLSGILNSEFDKIPPAAWETYVFTRIRLLGYRTLYNPSGEFYHRQRRNIFSFAKQIFRCGMGRINFFKAFPGEIAFKLYMLFPMLFLIYILAFVGLAIVNFPITGFPLIIYVSLLMVASYFPKHSSRFQAFYYLTMHLSYGLGMLYGLIANRRTWK